MFVAISVASCPFSQVEDSKTTKVFMMVKKLVMLNALKWAYLVKESPDSKVHIDFDFSEGKKDQENLSHKTFDPFQNSIWRARG
ncbi:MAG: hypothetical protein R2825_30575 [Saprospiraceae bacterium]